MNTALQKLVDNGWRVKVFRTVERRYLALATRFGQSDKAILPKIEVTGTEDEPILTRVEDGIPRQNATADTADDAIALLADQLFTKRERIKP